MCKIIPRLNFRLCVSVCVSIFCSYTIFSKFRDRKSALVWQNLWYVLFVFIATKQMAMSVCVSPPTDRVYFASIYSYPLQYWQLMSFREKISMIAAKTHHSWTNPKNQIKSVSPYSTGSACCRTHLPKDGTQWMECMCMSVSMWVCVCSLCSSRLVQ